MKYKLEMVTAASQLEPIIEMAEDKLFELQNQQDDATIFVKRSVKVQERRAKRIANVNSQLASAQAKYNSLEPGNAKDKAFADMKVVEARLLQLNVPGETDPVDEIIGQELTKELMNASITAYQEFLNALNARKAELAAA